MCKSSLIIFLSFHRPRKIQRVSAGDRCEQHCGQNSLFLRRIRLVCEDAERVEDSVCRDTAEQTARTQIHHHEHKSGGGSVDDLQKIRQKLRARTVEQIDNMPDAEGQQGNDNGGFEVVLPHGVKEQTTEDHLLKETDAEHRKYVQRGFDGAVIQRHAVPQIRREYQKHGQIPKHLPGGSTRLAKTVGGK